MILYDLPGGLYAFAYHQFSVVFTYHNLGGLIRCGIRPTFQPVQRWDPGAMPEKDE
jgi:hypothetical protein